jgi:hypothetical protein
MKCGVMTGINFISAVYVSCAEEAVGSGTEVFTLVSGCMSS